jgi:hypothetical protein
VTAPPPPAAPAPRRPRAPQPLTRAARFWAAFPLLLLGGMLLGWGYMVAIALDDPSFSVEPDYYRKAVGWDAHQRQVAHDRALGWALSSDLVATRGGAELSARLVDADGALVTGATVEVEAFHVARGAEIFRATLVEGPGGTYRAALPLRRAGIYELRFDVGRGPQAFRAVERRELGGPS